MGASGGPGAEALAARDRRRDAEGTAQDKAGRRDVEADDDDELLEAQGGCAAAPRMSMLILFSVGARELASERLSRGSGRERAMRAGGKGLDLLESVEKRGPKKKENKKNLPGLFSFFSLSLFPFVVSGESEKHREPRDVLVATPRRAVPLGAESPQLQQRWRRCFLLLVAESSQLASL